MSQPSTRDLCLCMQKQFWIMRVMKDLVAVQILSPMQHILRLGRHHGNHGFSFLHEKPFASRAEWSGPHQIQTCILLVNTHSFSLRLNDEHGDYFCFRVSLKCCCVPFNIFDVKQGKVSRIFSITLQYFSSKNHMY